MAMESGNLVRFCFLGDSFGGDVGGFVDGVVGC